MVIDYWERSDLSLRHRAKRCGSNLLLENAADLNFIERIASSSYLLTRNDGRGIYNLGSCSSLANRIRTGCCRWRTPTTALMFYLTKANFVLLPLALANGNKSHLLLTPDTSGHFPLFIPVCRQAGFIFNFQFSIFNFPSLSLRACIQLIL